MSNQTKLTSRCTKSGLLAKNSSLPGCEPRNYSVRYVRINLISSLNRRSASRPSAVCCGSIRLVVTPECAFNTAQPHAHTHKRAHYWISEELYGSSSCPFHCNQNQGWRLELFKLVRETRRPRAEKKQVGEDGGATEGNNDKLPAQSNGETETNI